MQSQGRNGRSITSEPAFPLRERRHIPMSVAATYLGHGIGLRPKHYGRFLEVRPPVDWVEVISENFMVDGGRPLSVLEKVRRDMPIALHGVSLSIGSVEPLNTEYLHRLRDLIRRIDPAIVSDHLCWGRHGRHYGHDLWPLPYTEEALAHVVARVLSVQEALGRQILLENVSSYVTFHDSSMSEWEFLSAVAERADCGILLDINNIAVSAHNNGFDAREYLRGVPVDRVAQFHLAGHSCEGAYLIDTHDQPVQEPVWALYAEAVAHFQRTSTLIEWDDNVPELEILVEESRHASRVEMEVVR
jgi:uncharacterized protein